MPGSGEGGALIAARLRLASVFVVVARWSTNLDVIFIIFGVRCTAMIKDEWTRSFLAKKGRNRHQVWLLNLVFHLYCF